jgi:hypothetical protein
VTSDDAKRKYAKLSMENNIQNSRFCELFPEIVEKYKENPEAFGPTQKNEVLKVAPGAENSSSKGKNRANGTSTQDAFLIAGILILVAVAVCVALY